MNILIGAVKHCNVDRLEVWAKSAYECFPEVKKILLCMDDEIPSNIKKLESLNFEIVHTPSPDQKNIDVMKYERHHAIAKYISNYAPTDIILATDTFDVFFQSNPFKWYESNRTNDLLIGSEGITIENEHWNRRVISKAFPLNIDDVLKNDVFCAGIIMGTVHVVSDLMSSIYNYTKYIKTEDSEGVDQGALNVLLTSNYFKSKLQKTTTTENFVVHCAVAGPTELFIPWGFKNNYKYDLPTFDGNSVVNKDGIPYCVVHQYNRVKEWNNFFVEKYKKIRWEDASGVLPMKYNPDIKNDIAVVVCTKPNSSYSSDWNKVMAFGNDDYMLCDVSSGVVPEIYTFEKFVPDNVINYDEKFLRDTLNFREQPNRSHWWNLHGGRNIIWFYPHFRMLYFYLLHPEYKFYWFFDDDVTWPDGRLCDFVKSHAKLDHDCMISYIFSHEDADLQPDTLSMGKPMVSYHSPNCNWLSHYPGDGDRQHPDTKKSYGSYFPLVGLSNKAMHTLWEYHRQGYYGYSEGYVPSTLAHAGLKLYSIYNKDSKIKVDESLVSWHRRYHQMTWENI